MSRRSKLVVGVLLFLLALAVLMGFALTTGLDHAESGAFASEKAKASQRQLNRWSDDLGVHEVTYISTTGAVTVVLCINNSHGISCITIPNR